MWKGGSEPHSHPSILDENDESHENYDNHANSWRLILEQPSHTLGDFPWKVKYQKLDFVNPSALLPFLELLEFQDFWEKIKCSLE